MDAHFERIVLIDVDIQEIYPFIILFLAVFVSTPSHFGLRQKLILFYHVCLYIEKFPFQIFMNCSFFVVGENVMCKGVGWCGGWEDTEEKKMFIINIVET